MKKVEYRESIESDSSDANQFDIRNAQKIWIKREVKKSFSYLINSVYPYMHFHRNMPKILMLTDFLA